LVFDGFTSRYGALYTGLFRPAGDDVPVTEVLEVDISQRAGGHPVFSDDWYVGNSKPTEVSP